MCHGGDDGLWGPEQSRARPASRTWRACRVFSISTRKRAGGQVAELQISPCLQRLPVRRPIDHWLDSGRSPRPPTPASPATSPPTGRWPGAYCCRIRLGLSVLSARARRTRCYPWRRVRRVQRSCLWDVWAAFCAVQGGVGNAPRRGCSQPPSVSCAFSMPPARSIGRPAPAGLAACGSGSGLAAGAQAGVGMLMSSPAYGSSGRGVSVASS